MNRVLLLCLLFGSRLSAADSPENAVRAFYRAFYARDAAALEKVVIPDSRTAKLVAAPKLDAQRLREIDSEIRELDLNFLSEPLLRGKPVEAAKDGSYPEGTVIRYGVAIDNSLTAVTVVRQKSGWKVDTRWWLASMEMQGPPAEGTPEYSIKRLLFATASYDRDEAKKWILPGSDVELLFLDAPSQPEPSDQLFALTMEMPIVEMRKGEWVRLPFDHAAEGTDEPNRKVYLGMFGMVDLPFVVMKRNGTWYVIPQPYYVMMNQ